MLGAFYLLIRAIEEENRNYATVYLLLAIFFEYMSLWTYESQFVIMLLAPLLLLALPRERARKWRLPVGAWFAVVAIYVVVTVMHYVHACATTHQASVLRTQWSVAPIVSDWVYNMAASLEFWAWSSFAPNKATTSQLAPAAVLSVVAFAGGIVAMIAASGGKIPGVRRLLGAIVIGLLLALLSFPAYLLLNSARSVWRTQTLSGLGSGVLFAAAIALRVAWVRRGGFNWVCSQPWVGWLCFTGAFRPSKRPRFIAGFGSGIGAPWLNCWRLRPG